MENKELLTLLAEHPLFKDASPLLLQQNLNKESLTEQSFLPGTEIYSSDSGEILVGILLNGTAQVCFEHGNEQALLKTMHAGDMFGIANLYAEEEPFPTRIMAIDPCHVLLIKGDAIKKTIESDPDLLRNYLRFQSKKIVFLNRKIMTLTAGSAEKKLAVYLLEHEQEGRVVLPCSMSELARLLNVGRASLYRALDMLEEHGMIQKNAKDIHILNRSKLFTL